MDKIASATRQSIDKGLILVCLYQCNLMAPKTKGIDEIKVIPHGQQAAGQSDWVNRINE